MATETETQLLEQIAQRLDRIENEKLDRIVTRLESLEVEQRGQGEKLEAINQRIASLEGNATRQDNRLWGFVLLCFSLLIGFLTKLLFFSPSA